MLAAAAAVLGELQAILQNLFVLGAEVVYPLTDRTFKFYHVVLRHMFLFKRALGARADVGN